MSAADRLAIEVAARHGPRTAGRLGSLVARSVRLTWRASRRLLFVSAALQLLGALAVAAQVIVVRAILEAVIDLPSASEAVAATLIPVVALAVLTAVVAVAGAVQVNQQRLLAELVMRDTWGRLFDVAASVPLRAYESAGFHDRLQRVQTNTLSRPYQVTQGLVSITGGLLGSAGVAVAIAGIEPLLLPLLILAGVPTFVTTRRESRLEFGFAVGQTPALRLRQYLARLQTGRDEAKEVRAFGLASTLRERFEAAYETYFRDLEAHLHRRTRLAIAGNVASATLLAVTLLVLVWMVGQGRVGVADAGAAVVAVRLLTGQVGRVLAGAQQIFESGLFLDDLDGFAALRPAAEDAEDGDPAPERFRHLTVDGVGFTYPGAGAPALRDVSMELHAGEIVALVGENGSGKTTLAKILAALYEPDVGAVRWDGVDVRSYRRQDLRNAVAVIFQDFVRYAFTVRDNVALGRPQRLDDEAGARRAAQRAELDGLVSSLPRGWETVLSTMFTGGVDISGGQWQRVALARAFFRDAPFVILDEPTAALDPRAEHRLFGSLRQLMAGRTVLFVSHRFSTVRSADRIYVLHDGDVAEHGTHEQLMEANGRYAELFRLQAAAYLGVDT